MIDVHSLRVFVSVAEKLSVTGAGEALGLTQSAVSHQVAKLERELKADLLERHGRTIRVTPAGLELVRAGREVIQRIDALAGVVRTAADPNQGRLRVGATVTACQYLLPDPIRELRECFPGYALNIRPGDSAEVCRGIETGELDLGIVIGGKHVGKLPTQPLFRDELGLVCHPSHRFASLPKISAADLVGQQWVMYAQQSATFDLVERHLATLRVRIERPIELGSVEAIKELVKVGLGISALAKWATKADIEQGSLLWQPLPGRKLQREWLIVLPADRQPSLAEQCVVELCRTAGRNLVG
ncbi:MAG: LysR family transcriptional regulator [Tepidisphaeraceae bacterium]